MSSGSKKQQTMAKMTRERNVKEKRALKAEKKEARKQAAALAANPPAVEVEEGDEAAEVAEPAS